MSLSEQQGQRLGLSARTQWSPQLEKCCLLVSANESYQDTAEDIAVLTGLSVSKSTQQRLVHRHDFPSESVDCGVKEMSLDGGKVRLRTTKGYSCKIASTSAPDSRQLQQVIRMNFGT